MEIPNFKFCVIKHRDIEEYLDAEDVAELERITGKISVARYAAGKTDNRYVVINTDEPYIADIVEVMKRNGHWG